MLSVRNLTHVYARGVRALNNVSLEIPAGMFGLLGPNGAGKADSVTSTRRPDGGFDVTVTVDAHKFYADGKGAQTEVRMNEPVSIGLFLAKPGDADFGRNRILSLAPSTVVSGTQRFHFVTRVAPAYAGIDTYNEWIDRNSDDNVVAAGGAT